MQICNEVEYEYLIYKQFVVKRLGFIEMCYVFSYLCVPLIGSDHVVNKSHVCKELMFLGMVWFGRKRIEGFSPLHFIQCPNI